MSRRWPLALILLAAPVTAQTPAKAPADPNKVICRTSAEIGSLIPRKKECHTRAEWTALQQQARVNSGEMMDRQVSSSAQTQ